MTEGEQQSPSRVVRSLSVATGVVVAVAAAVFVARAFGYLGRAGAVASWSLATANWTLTAVAAVDTALAAGRTGTAAGRALRRFWLLVGGSAVFTGAGAGLSGALGSGQNTVPMSAFALYAVSMLLVVAGLIGLPVPWRHLGSKVTVTLDLMIITSATVVMLWFIATEILRVPADPALTSLTLTLGIVAGGGLIGVGKIMLTGWEPVDQTSIRLLAGAMVISAMGAGGLAALSPLTGLTPEILVLPSAAAGWLFAARRQRAVLGLLVEPTVRTRRKPFSVVPYVAVALYDALTVVAQFNHTPNHEWLLVGSIVLTALVIARQLTAFYDNARLVSRLDDSLREVRSQEHRFRVLVRNATDVISISDRDGRVTYISPGVETMLGMTPEEMVGGKGQLLVHPDDVKEFVQQIAPAAAGPGATAEAEARFRRADGTWRWLRLHSTNFYNDPDIRGMVTNARDITEARSYQEELAHQASHDDLTGLLNRTLFARVCDEALAADAPERTVMVLVDLDDFKLINDRLGHAVGDALLRDVGTRLRGGLRPQDTVARLGGDEFAVLLRGVAPDERIDIASRIMGELERPVRAEGHDLLVRASVGVAPGTPGTTAAELLRRADLAMYVAKNQGRGRCAEFDEAMDLRAQEHARLAADLSAAVERTELTVVYQPIVALPHGELAGVEALVRWTHPVRGFVSPAEFIPVAERTGLIVALGAWILSEACRQAAAWLRDLGPAAPSRITVNVSARQLIEPDFPAVVEAALRASGLPAERLVVEITETAVFDGGPALAAVSAMKDMGVRVALDDFGTGHSSLGLLRTVPLDVLKVDKSFVDGVGQSPEQEAIITSLSQIGAAMRLLVVAEGVETAAQAERLFEIGYRYAQGYHFARPLKPDEIVAFALKPAPV
jgi:diguanylate cyclase (GGDEF)-like protein/PAS domain S-box-containing protein